MNNFVQSVSQLVLLDILEVFFKHLIKVEDERFGRPIAHVHNFLECHLDRHIDLLIFFHRLSLYTANTFS